MIKHNGVDNGTPGRHNAWGYNVPSLTWTIYNVDDCWHPLPVWQTSNYFFLFFQLVDKMLSIRNESRDNIYLLT